MIRLTFVVGDPLPRTPATLSTVRCGLSYNTNSLRAWRTSQNYMQICGLLLSHLVYVLRNTYRLFGFAWPLRSLLRKQESAIWRPFKDLPPINTFASWNGDDEPRANVLLVISCTGVLF